MCTLHSAVKNSGQGEGELRGGRERVGKTEDEKEDKAGQREKERYREHRKEFDWR